VRDLAARKIGEVIDYDVTSRRAKQVTIRLRLTSGATRHGGFVLRRTRRRDELRRASNGVN
jgi:hypothetical protein